MLTVWFSKKKKSWTGYLKTNHTLSPPLCFQGLIRWTWKETAGWDVLKDLLLISCVLFLWTDGAVPPCLLPTPWYNPCSALCGYPLTWWYGPCLSHHMIGRQVPKWLTQCSITLCAYMLVPVGISVSVLYCTSPLLHCFHQINRNSKFRQ